MNYKVYADGAELSVKTCRVFQKPYNTTDNMEYVTLASNVVTELVIESEIPVTGVIARPLSAGAKPKIKDGRIVLSIDRPVKLSIEINGSSRNNLMVFADREKYSGFEADNNTIVFKKGVHNTDTVIIDKSHTTLYLEDGAVLNGNIIVKDCADVSICGLGTVCMEKYLYEMRKDFARSIDVLNCTDVRISDITINDSNDWSLRINGCIDVHIENVKIFGCRGNSDGIDVCGSKNVTVTDIFTRVWDDSFVVKALGTGNCENVVFKNSVLWNDFARPMEVGVELRADEVRNIRFENIDVIHSSTGYPVMGIHHGDHARVSDIVFKNIRIEDTPGAQLFDIRIADSVWNRDKEMGDIRNITFSDINYIGTSDNEILLSASRIEGYSEKHNIEDVRFHNITLDGKAAVTAKDFGLDIRKFVSNVSITADDYAEEAAMILSNIFLKDEFVLGKDGFYRGIVGVSLKNESDADVKGTAKLAVSPKNAETEREFEFNLPAHGSAEYCFDMRMQAGTYVFYLKCGCALLENIQLCIRLDMPIVRGAEVGGCPLYKFVNYYGTDCVGVRVSADTEGLIFMAELDGAAETDFVLYTAARPVTAKEGEVVFSAEETDFGEVCALVKEGDGLVPAPQLRCPLEIIYVFKNEPKVGEIRQTKLKLCNKEPLKVPFEELGLSGENEFIMELAANTEETCGLRYPYTLFHSTMPDKTAHMFGRVKIIDCERER